MKKALALVMVAATLLLTLIACSSSDTATESTATATESTATTTESTESTASSSNDGIRIGLSIGTLTDERWVRDVAYFEAQAEELGFELLVQAADSDATKQASQCENMVADGLDVLIIQPVDSDAAGVIANMAKENDVITIAYDRLIKGGDVDFYATFDNVRVGEVQAQFVLDNAPTGNYILLKGEQSDNNAHLVYEGQMNIMQEYIDRGDITIVAEQWCSNWMPDQAQMHVENALTANDNDIQGVMAPNDGTAGGAIVALTDQDMAGLVPIAGQDADLAACMRIVAGTQTGTVYKPTQDLNDAIIAIALACAQGNDPVEVLSDTAGTWSTSDNDYKDVTTFSLDVIAVDINNINETVIADGFHSLEDVYAEIPEDQWPEH